MFGVNGVSVIGHGRAMADAVQRAIDTARMTVASGFVEKLNQELTTVRTRVGDGA